MDSKIRFRGASDDALSGLLSHTARRRFRVADIEKVYDNSGRVIDKRFVRQDYVASDAQQLARWDYYAPNTKRQATVLVADVDQEYDDDLLASFPVTPNFVHHNVESEHWQATWFINPVYGAITKNRALYDYASTMLSYQLSGDSHFSRGLSRNPFFTMGPYRHHYQHGEVSSLRDIVNALDDDLEERFRADRSQRNAERRPQIIDFVDGAGMFQRRTFLFETVRREAYKIRWAGKYIDFREHLMPIAEETNTLMTLRMRDLNDTRGRLHPRTLEATCRSVANWTNEHLVPGSSKISYWTAEQQRRGGLTQGPRNKERAGFQEDFALGRAKGAAANVANADSRREQAMQMYLEGLSDQEIGEQLGVGQKTIINYLGPKRSRAFRTQK